MNIIRNLFLLIFIFFNYAWSANIIFDLNGVLIDTSKISFAWVAGPLKFIGLFNPLTIEATFFNHLNLIRPRLPTTPKLYYKDRILLPQLMCDWLAGTITSAQLLSTINSYIEKISATVDSKRKIKLLRALAICMFDPQKYVKTVKPLRKGKRLLKKCFNQTDGHGNRIHNLFGLSNCSAEVYYFLQKNPAYKFFSLLNNIIVSGNAHLLKPDPVFFEYAFEQFGIDPDKELTIYIDDELHNIKAAEALGKKQLHCIHCKNQNFKEIKKYLKKLGVIS